METLSQETGRERLMEPRKFRSRLSSLFSVDFVVKPVGKKPFRAEIEAYTLGRLKMARMAFSAHRTARLPLPASAHREYFLVNHQQSGHVIVRQDGRESEICPGDFYILNATRDFHIETGEVVTHSICVPASEFRTVFPEVDYCTSIKFSSQTGAGPVVGAFLSSTFELARTLDDNGAGRVVDALPHVLAIALSSRTQEPLARSRLTVYQRERVKDYVRRNIREASMDCEFISKAVQLSPRYLYDLFADEPMPIMRWVWSERLNNCRHELSLAALRSKSIGEIAYSWGFRELAHFSRSFRAAFGQSPREFRNSTLKRDEAGKIA
jgi:AraC family transcriptional activator of tynA and feaB